MTKDYNKKYYTTAAKLFQDIGYYPGKIIQDAMKHLKRYFPDADEGELKHSIEWALADVWNGGCELEEYEGRYQL